MKNKKTLRQVWNVVLDMIGNLDDRKVLEDIGQKGKGKDKYHEFIIDGYIFEVRLKKVLD